MSESMDEVEQHELEYENVLTSLDAVSSLERSVLESKKVDRMTMESLHKLVPESANKNYPLVTFTMEASEQNYEVALESFSIAKAVAIAAVSGILGAILMKIIAAFRSDKVSNRIEFLDKKKSELKDYEKDLKKTVARLKKAELNVEDRRVVDAIERMDLDLLIGKAKDANKTVEDLIRELSKGGRAYRILDKWSSDIANYSSEFKKRVRMMAEIVEVMYTVRGNDIQKLQQKAEQIAKESDDRFKKDMTDLTLFFQSLDHGESLVAFIDEQVDGTQPFRDMITGHDSLTSYTSLYSNASDQIEKNMKEIEKKYAPILSGQGSSDAYRKAQSAARNRTRTSDGEVVVEMDISTTMINPIMQRAIKDAEDSVKDEALALNAYRLNLNKALILYQKAVVARERVNQTAMKMLMDIDNRAQ